MSRPGKRNYGGGEEPDLEQFIGINRTWFRRGLWVLLVVQTTLLILSGIHVNTDLLVALARVSGILFLVLLLAYDGSMD